MVYLLSAAFIGLCVIMIYFDLRYMRIPDLVSIGFVGLFAVSVVLLWPDIDMSARILTGAAVFAVCFALFAFNIMGGGDTKVIPAMALFVPLGALSHVLLLFALCLLGSILVVVMLRSGAKQWALPWAVVTSRKLPMGLAIGTTGAFAEIARLV